MVDEFLWQTGRVIPRCKSNNVGEFSAFREHRKLSKVQQTSGEEVVLAVSRPGSLSPKSGLIEVSPNMRNRMNKSSFRSVNQVHPQQITQPGKKLKVNEGFQKFQAYNDNMASQNQTLRIKKSIQVNQPMIDKTYSSIRTRDLENQVQNGVYNQKKLFDTSPVISENFKTMRIQQQDYFHTPNYKSG